MLRLLAMHLLPVGSSAVEDADLCERQLARLTRGLALAPLLPCSPLHPLLNPIMYDEAEAPGRIWPLL